MICSLSASSSASTRLLSSARKVSQSSRGFFIGRSYKTEHHRRLGSAFVDSSIHHHNHVTNLRNVALRGLATSSTSKSNTTRSKSSVAYADDHLTNEDEMIEFEDIAMTHQHHPSQGHAAAAAAASTVAKSHAEAWMINLGRNDDNIWLSKPRDEKWWTGVHPQNCPGKFLDKLFDEWIAMNVKQNENGFVADSR